MSVGLPAHIKGTHMSRFVEVLHEHADEVTMRTIPTLLARTQQRLESGRRKVDGRLSLLPRARCAGHRRHAL